MDTASLPARDPGHKIPGQRSAAAACVVFTLYAGGAEEAFAALRSSDPTTVLHLYPDGERTWHVRGGTGIMEQLRRNERYRKSEAWLRQGTVREVRVGPVLVDGTTRTAYVFVSGLRSSLDVTARRPYLPEVYPPLDTEVATYLVLARATSWSGGVTLDPESLWVLPRERLNTAAAGDPVQGALEVVPVGDGSLYTVIAGGSKPATWPDLRNFAFFSPLNDGDNHLMGPGVSPAHAFAVGSQTGWGLTVFGWGLGDYPEENILLQFKTDAELALAAYNAAARHAKYGVVAAAKSGSYVPVYLAGFSQLAQDKVEQQCDVALQTLQKIDSRYLEVPLEAVAHLLEERLGMTMEELGGLLLQLARAEKEGRFAQVYEELMPQGLERLVRLFADYFRDWPWEWQRIPAFIRALAIRYEKALLAGTGLQPTGIGAIIVEGVRGTLVDYVLNALIDYIAMAPQPQFVRTIVQPQWRWFGRLTVWIDTGSVTDLVAHWWLANNWLEKWLVVFGPPEVSDPRRFYEGFDPIAWWNGHFASWGVKLGMYPRKASAVVSLVYTYAEIMDKYQEGRLEVFKPYYHNLLRVMDFAYEATFVEQARQADNQWAVLGVAVPSAEEATVVLHRTRVEGSWWARQRRHDVAVVNVYSGSFVQQGDVSRARTWVETAMRCIQSREYYEARPKGDRGLDIAAVVFTQDLGATEARNVRDLADSLREEFPKKPAFGYSQTPDTFSDAIFLIWWEERGGTRELWYSVINWGPAEITEKLQLEVVRSLAIGDTPETVIHRCGRSCQMTPL